MANVITYRLAYLNRSVALCSACVESGDHEQGTLGPVQHGKHVGTCCGAHCPESEWAYQIQTRGNGRAWTLDGIGGPNQFATAAAAESAIAELRALGDEWAAAEYRVVEAR